MTTDDENLLAALQRLDAARIAQANSAIADAVDDNGGIVALPGDMTIHHLEKHLPHRARLHGYFQTTSVAAFADYIRDGRDDVTPRVFVHPVKLEATAFFNIGDAEFPGHGDDRAKVTLLPTAEAVALAETNKATYLQADFLDWVTDWAHCITFYREGTVIPWPQAIAALRALTITRARTSQHVEQTARRETGSLERIEVQETDTLPDGMGFLYQPAQCLPHVNALIRISLLPADDDNPKRAFIRTRVVSFESQQETIHKSFVEELFNAIRDGVVILSGTYEP